MNLVITPEIQAKLDELEANMNEFWAGESFTASVPKCIVSYLEQAHPFPGYHWVVLMDGDVANCRAVKDD